MKISIETTADGSPTLFREDLDEHYHSVKGALAESRHVYIEESWRKASQNFDPVSVFEVGFGSGLNAALTAADALSSGIYTNYYSVELYPLPDETIKQLTTFLPDSFREVFQSVNCCQWDEWNEINSHFRLKKMHADFLETEIPRDINCIYFDAFAPEKQSEMWDEKIFRKLYDALAPGGIMTTYCAKGSVRRLLQHIGFLTERLPGPPGGKREILRGSKIR